MNKTMDRIIEHVASVFGTTKADIVANDHTPTPATCRHVVAHLARQHTPFSNAEIGRALGGRDNATIIYSRKRAVRILAEDSVRGDWARRAVETYQPEVETSSFADNVGAA